ncbi:MAG: aldo/keto reductase, partial [Bacteroidales bacterium]|nr:aldo/keto reductase [Bacteroidales bacterium]
MDNINRRDFLKIAGTAAAVTAVSATGCGDAVKSGSIANTTTSVSKNIPTDKMTYRINPKTGDKISILGYGFMRLPTISNQSARESGDEIDQETVNKLVDYAIEHGLNLFDTSPAYCRGMSEHATGIALSRYPRDKYFVSTKLSNFSPQQWNLEESVAMYKKSLKELQVDYID